MIPPALIPPATGPLAGLLSGALAGVLFGPLAGLGGKVLAGLAAAAALAWAAVAIIGRLLAAGADRVHRRTAEAGNRYAKERRDVEDAIDRADPAARRHRLLRWRHD